MSQRTVRPGFTLLEVMLSMAIGILLLSALYVAVDTQLKSAQQAREIVEQSTLARTLLTRMADDITSTVNLSDPGRFRNQQNAANSMGGGMGGGGTGASMGGGMGMGTGGTGGMGGTGGTGGTGGAGSTSSTTNATSSVGNSGSVQTGPNTGATGTSYTIPLGLMGDSTSLHLYVTGLPKELVQYGVNDVIPPLSDTRRISYWLVGGGDSGGGLAKQEVQPITSDDVENLPPGGVGNESQHILADEVRSLTFSYFDGMNWNDSWDSTVIGADGVTPIGPPMAVAIEIGLPVLGRPDLPPKIYRHVVCLVTANGAIGQNSTTGQTGTGQSAGGQSGTPSGSGTTP